MRLVKALHLVYCAVRANLLGGWTDQLRWCESAAVVNFALGWHDDKCHQGYPLMLDRLGRFYSAVSGRGTGLGISSIRAAMMYRQAFPERGSEYIRFVLEYEKAILGTEGGWQDQIGGLEPGFKLIATPDDDDRRHREFDVRYRVHPVIDRLVLFDTGIRRNAGDIGDKVRYLMLTDEGFCNHLRDVAKSAILCFEAGADEMVAACNLSWQGFLKFVPQMALPKPLPHTELIKGHMLLGAGGGGFGLAFVDQPDSQQEVIDLLTSNGFWATTPLLLPGIKLVKGEE